MFKKKWNLSTQKIKYSKIATNLPAEDEINLFLNEWNKLTKNIKKNIFSIMMKRVTIL